MIIPSRWSIERQWIALFFLWALQGVLFLGQFLESQVSSTDLSNKEILLVATLMLWSAVNLFLILLLLRKSNWLSRLLNMLKTPAIKDGIFLISTVILFLLILLGIFQPIADQTAFWFMGYIDRLSPLLNLTAVVCIEIVTLILFTTLRKNIEDKRVFQPFFIKLQVVLILLGLTTIYISRTRMGIETIYKGDWARGLPAVPLLEWQILLACLFCFLMIFIESNPRLLKIQHLDFRMALTIWAFTVALWLSQPVVTNTVALEPLEPNFEIYPFNDSQTYDEYAQSLLIGNGFGGRIPQRPLYIAFLAGLHFFVGQDYEKMIFLQTFVFALLPVLLYLFGREFFGRPIGISVALLAALRDVTSNLVSPFTGNVSYSKLYLSEIPTAMLLILFLWIGIRWIRSGFPAFLSFLMGGVLGIAMLIRTQVVVAVPVILLIAFLCEPKKLKLLFRNTALMMTILLLIIAPWLWRNWRLTGSLIFDSPESQTINLALRYSRINGVEPDALPFPGETNTEYTLRLEKIARDAIISNPLGAVKGIFSSFLNHGVNNILLFPIQNDLKNGADLLVPSDAFWEEWEGVPTSSQLALILFYIFLLGLGIVTAWHRNGWIGLLPLAMNLAYNLWTSLALLSGQRFLLSMDWSIYLYYMLGLFAFLSIFLFTLERGRSVISKWYEINSSPPLSPTTSRNWQYYFSFGILFLGLGLSLPSVERIFPQRYLNSSPTELAHSLLSSPALNQAEFGVCIRDVLKREDINLQQGLALYPRYYEAKRGESFTDSFGYKVADEGRLVFTLLRESSVRIVFPISETPSFFPNASDVTLVYGDDGALWFAFVQKGGVEVFYASNDFDVSLCE